MKILQLGDVHLQDRKPICRTDDSYLDTQMDKLDEVVHTANKHDVPIVCVGDLFNTHFISDKLKTYFGEIITQLINPLYLVWGNHDTEYHSKDLWDKTSLGAILANNDKVRHISSFKNDFGISWDYIDWNCDLVQTGSDLLLTHKAVYNSKMSKGRSGWIEKDKTFGFPVTDKILKPYKIILCGHWHKQYVFQHRDKKVLNSGALLRKSVDITDDPAVYLIDLKTAKHTTIYLETAKPFSEVISKKHLKLQKIQSNLNQVELSEIIKLKCSGDEKSFINKLKGVLKSDKLDKGVVSVINEVLAELTEKGEIN